MEKMETEQLLLAQAARTMELIRGLSADMSRSAKIENPPEPEFSPCRVIDARAESLSLHKTKLLIKSVEVCCLREANAYKAKCNAALLELARAKNSIIPKRRRKIPSKKD